MSRAAIIAIAILTIIAATGFVLLRTYNAGRQVERAGSIIRAEGMKAEREVLNAKVRNVTIEQRCKRNGLDFVPDEAGGHCN